MMMKKNVAVALAIFVVLCCALSVTVSAIDYYDSKAEIVKDQTYFLVSDSKSGDGAGAFCLNNQFVDFGSSQDNMSLCTKGTDGKYTVARTIAKSDLKVCFSGKTEISLNSSDNISNEVGGLNGLGITFDSTKTNIFFKIESQSLIADTQYYVYIPKNYFVDASGIGNKGGYVEIEKSKFGCYAGDTLDDLMSVFSDVAGAFSLGAEAFAKALFS